MILLKAIALAMVDENKLVDLLNEDVIIIEGSDGKSIAYWNPTYKEIKMKK